jgi:hypothetical protein
VGGGSIVAWIVLDVPGMQCRWVCFLWMAACGGVTSGRSGPDAGVPGADAGTSASDGNMARECSIDSDCATNRCVSDRCSVQCELPGLLAYFPFDGDTVDHSGHQHDIIASHVAAINGPFRAAYSFNGATSLMQLTGTGLLGSRTLCAWVKPRLVEQYGNPIFAGGVANQGDFFSIEGNNPSNPCGMTGEPFIDHWGFACYKAGSTIPNDSWSFVCYESDGSGRVRFYRNGTLSEFAGNTYQYDISTLTVGSTKIGGSTTRASMLGAIDEVTVWDRALSADELMRLWNLGNSCVP